MSMHKRIQTVRSEARTMLKRIAEKCEEEALKGELLHPLHAPNIRAVEYTGLSITTVRKIKNRSLSSDEDISPPRIKKPQKSAEEKVYCSHEDEIIIRNIISDFYTEQKIVPTDLKLLTAIRKEIDFPWSVRVLRKVLQSIGFKWKKSNKIGRVLVERPSIIVRRTMFLRAIHYYRTDDRNIIYIGGMWVDDTLTFGRCQKDEQIQSKEQNASSCERLIIVHAASKNGFLPNTALILKSPSTNMDYEGEMYEIFERWVIETLLPNIPERSVVVMDNAPYHSVQLNKAPSKYGRKIDLIDWLVQNNVSHSDSMRKCELVELIAYHKPPAKIYKIDEIIKFYEHSVLRLPPNMNELNPMELAWAQIQRRITDNNKWTVTHERLQSLVVETMDAITVDEWRNFCEATEEIEQKYWETDNLLELAMDSLALDMEDTDEMGDPDGNSSEDL